MGFLTKPKTQESLAPSSLNQAVPSPKGGWNVRDPKDAMEPTDAVILDNWFPHQYYIETRKGYTIVNSGLGGAVETLATLIRGGTEYLIAAANGKLWDVKTAGVNTSLATGFTNNRWQTATFNVANQASMVLVNGYDAPQIYNGTTVTAATISGTGLTVANLIGCFAFKSRMWYWERADASGATPQRAWYSAAGAIAGTLTAFDFGQIQNIDGTITAIGSWTIDGGQGVDDYFVVLFSTGKVAVYQGTDPADATKWSLVGVYRSGGPLGGPRSITRYGPDIVQISDNGYYPLSKSLNLDLSSRDGGISSKIYGEVSNLADSVGDKFGWQAVLWPKGNMLIFNVPTTDSVTFRQHVMNTITGAWCSFSGYNAASWSVFKTDLYFGDSLGNICKAYTGYTDNGNPINCVAQQAYNYLGDNRSQLKAIRSIRPIIEISAGSIAINISIQYDFKDLFVYNTFNVSTGSSSPWDTSPWDVTPWGDSGQVTDNVLLMGGIGRALSLTLNLNTSGQQAFWYSTAYHYELGGYF